MKSFLGMLIALLALAVGDAAAQQVAPTYDAELAAKVGVTLDASTSGGRVSVSDVAVTANQVSKTSIRGTVNGGGPGLKARTSGGSIIIKRHGEKLALVR